MPDFVQQFFDGYMGGRLGALTDDTPLLESGLLNSVAVLSFVAFIESELDVTVPANEIVASNFLTLSAVKALVARLSKKK